MQVLIKLAVTAFFVWLFSVAVTSFKPGANMRASLHPENISTSYDCDQLGEAAL